jgi:hypothetical protein
VVTIAVQGDSLIEANERFVVSLNSANSPVTITVPSALGVINNDDTATSSSSSVIKPYDDDFQSTAEGWLFEGVTYNESDQGLYHTFRQGEAEASFIAPHTYTNPLNRYDVDGSGQVTALDALRIINALSRRVLISSSGDLLVPNEGILSHFQYVDVNVDGKMTPLDALQVINGLARANRMKSSQASEANTAAVTSAETSTNVVSQLSTPPSVLASSKLSALVAQHPLESDGSTGLSPTPSHDADNNTAREIALSVPTRSIQHDKDESIESIDAVFAELSLLGPEAQID